MSQRILILSGTQLSVNPRVVKEADALANAGYSVEVVGGLFDASFADRERHLHETKPWKYTMLVDASSERRPDKMRWLWLRMRRRIWREAHARVHVANARQLGYLAPEMLAYAKQHPADLTIAHNPASLWVAIQLMKRGERVAIDMEDWYSEDLAAEEKVHFPAEALSQWEGEALRGAAFSLTTSRAMSDALSSTYGCKAPAIVFNSFASEYRDSIDGQSRDRVNKTLPSLCWFSQVIGPHRGLETLMDALHSVNVAAEVHLRGISTQSYRDELIGRAPESWRERIFFHSQVPHAELISRIAEHDVGLASEIPHSRSRALTITNKLPLYLLAGVPVVASDTDGQREAASLANGAVFLYKADDPRDMASTLNRLLGDSQLRSRAHEAALKAASGVFSWSNSNAVLVSQVKNALSPAR